MNEHYININTFVRFGLVGNFVQSTMQTATTILTEQKNRKHKEMEKKTIVHREMKLMWQWMEFWRHVVYCIIVILWHGIYTTRFLRLFNFSLGLCSRYYCCHYHCYCCCCSCSACFCCCNVSDWLSLLSGFFPPTFFAFVRLYFDCTEWSRSCCRFFQTILPVNYLIKWNGCFKY